MTLQRRLILATTLLATTLLVACTGSTSQTSVDHVSRAKELLNAPYSRILIVGITPRASSAREFEEVLAKDLSKKKTHAFGYHRLASRADVNEEIVNSLVETHRADAVLIVTARLVSVDPIATHERTRIQPLVRGGGLVDFFRYDYEEYTMPPSADLQANVQLVTDMFDVKSDQRVYTAELSTEYAETTSEIIINESRELAKRLRKDNMVR